jgi:hypothetical protein
MFWQSPGSNFWSVSFEYQIRASLMKLKRARCTTVARSRCVSVPKKMVAPNIRWNAATSEENGYQPVLSPRQTVTGMSGHLQNELAIPPFVKKFSGNRPFDRQPTEYKRPGREPKTLDRVLPFQTNTGNRFCSPKLLLGNQKLTRHLVKDRRRRLEITMSARIRSDLSHFHAGKLTPEEVNSLKTSAGWIFGYAGGIFGMRSLGRLDRPVHLITSAATESAPKTGTFDAHAGRMSSAVTRGSHPGLPCRSESDSS